MEKALSTCFYLFDICSICIQPCLARNNLKLDIYDLVISSRRTTFIFAIGEVDPQSSERQERQKEGQTSAVLHSASFCSPEQ